MQEITKSASDRWSFLYKKGDFRERETRDFFGRKLAGKKKKSIGRSRVSSPFKFSFSCARKIAV